MENALPASSWTAIAARLVAFCFMVSALAGCASTAPPYSLNKLGMKRAIVVEPAHDDVLKLTLGDWGLGPPFNQRRADERLVSAALAGWESEVAGAFTNELVRGLAARGYTVRRLNRNELQALREGEGKSLAETIVVLSFVEAGFTYGTLTDRPLRPYVQFALRYEFGNGRPIGMRSIAISERSLSPIVSRFPPLRNYSVLTVESLQRDPSEPIAALRALAAQAGQQVLSETFY